MRLATVPTAALAVLCLAMWLCVGVELASADGLADCPEAAVEYQGSDDVVRELRAVRADERAACLAVRDRLEAVREAADGGLATDGAIATAVAGAASQAHDDAQPGSDAQHPAYAVAPDGAPQSTVALSSDDRASLTDMGDTAHRDAWWLLGLVAVTPLALLLTRGFWA